MRLQGMVCTMVVRHPELRMAFRLQFRERARKGVRIGTERRGEKELKSWSRDRGQMERTIWERVTDKERKRWIDWQWTAEWEGQKFFFYWLPEVFSYFRRLMDGGSGKRMNKEWEFQKKAVSRNNRFSSINTSKTEIVTEERKLTNWSFYY